MATEAIFLFDKSPPAGNGVSAHAAESRRARTAAKKTISDLRFQEAVLAVKESANCQDLKELQTRLIASFHQNSQETRLRYARFVLHWFFPDGFDGVARRTWTAYQDDKILTDVLRYLYLQHEPVMGACVAECLFPLEIGMRLPSTVFDRFLSGYFGGDPAKKTTQRLKSNLKFLGILERSRGAGDRLTSPGPSKTSLLILTHHIFAPTEPRTIELHNLLANPFWKYLGFKSEDEVRRILREADASGFVGKYVVADQLEQVTTCLTIEELLAKKARL
ncbi:MAG: hypothetical protein NTY19_04095 [Planctomycetota bacterium]|nr:hypothetical protein [Planctomycetota bacterium]